MCLENLGTALCIQEISPPQNSRHLQTSIGKPRFVRAGAAESIHAKASPKPDFIGT